jgi:hypothetical protein
VVYNEWMAADIHSATGISYECHSEYSNFSASCAARSVVCDNIESMFACLSDSLNCAANYVIPVFRSDFLKYWWNQELDELKSNSCSTHSIWLDAGRPMYGPIYDAKRRAKAAYKTCIRNNQKLEQQSVSNDLHDALIQKSTSCFWKSWNNKFGKKKVTSKTIEGFTDNQLISNGFAEYFCVNGNSESTADCVLLENAFMKRLSNYRNDDDDVNLKIDVTLVDCVISKLKKGKASGADHLASEHFQYCHPIVISILAMLFNLMIYLSLFLISLALVY